MRTTGLPTAVDLMNAADTSYAPSTNVHGVEEAYASSLDWTNVGAE